MYTKMYSVHFVHDGGRDKDGFTRIIYDNETLEWSTIVRTPSHEVVTGSQTCVVTLNGHQNNVHCHS
jgi:hypothetical protein